MIKPLKHVVVDAVIIAWWFIFHRRNVCTQQMFYDKNIICSVHYWYQQCCYLG